MIPVDSIAIATAYGAITSLGIIAGTVLGVFARLSHGVIARTTSIGSGLLLAAASVELAVEVLKHSPYIGIVSLLIGAASFSIGNAWLSNRGAQNRKRCGECVARLSESQKPNSAAAIMLGTAMDAVPEGLVLGLVLHAHGPDAALIAAIALGNLPEAMSASSGMREMNRSTGWILGLWGVIALGTTLLTAAGFALAGVISADTLLYLQALGAGALLAMVSETMLPEAAHEGQAFSGLLTALGFAAMLLLGAVT